MRNMFADTFYEAAKKDPRLCVVVADISPAGSMEKLRKEYPNRFINTGVAEQIMIGMCAGMAMRGLKPFAYTIATFALFRPYEFVRDDLCYQGLPVTVVGVGGGSPIPPWVVLTMRWKTWLSPARCRTCASSLHAIPRKRWPRLNGAFARRKDPFICAWERPVSQSSPQKLVPPSSLARCGCCGRAGMHA